MRYRNRWISFLLVAVLLGGCYLTRRQPDEIFETWESTGQPFKIRITAYLEKPDFGPLAEGRYQFEAWAESAQQWQEIFWFRHDDPNSIPTDQVRFVNQRIGYVFIECMYAVTTDAGKTWSVLDDNKDRKSGKCISNRIKDVQLTETGTGIMSQVIDPGHNTVSKLYTRDFGKSWQKEP